MLFLLFLVFWLFIGIAALGLVFAAAGLILQGLFAIVIWPDKPPALRLVVYLAVGATVGWIVGFFRGLSVYADYSDRNWGTWTANESQMKKIVDFSCIPAAIAGAVIGYGILVLVQKTKAERERQQREAEARSITRSP